MNSLPLHQRYAFLNVAEQYLSPSRVFRFRELRETLAERAGPADSFADLKRRLVAQLVHDLGECICWSACDRESTRFYRAVLRAIDRVNVKKLEMSFDV